MTSLIQFDVVKTSLIQFDVVKTSLIQFDLFLCRSVLLLKV